MLNELSLFFVNVAVPAGAVDVRVPWVVLWLPKQLAITFVVAPRQQIKVAGKDAEQSKEQGYKITARYYTLKGGVGATIAK